MYWSSRCVYTAFSSNPCNFTTSLGTYAVLALVQKLGYRLEHLVTLHLHLRLQVNLDLNLTLIDHGVALQVSFV